MGLSCKTSPFLDFDQAVKLLVRVEGEKSRLRHYFARLHRRTFCYSKSLDMLRYSVRLSLCL